MIGEVYEEITDSLHALEEMPHQLVHGDLNASNLLVMDSGHSQVAALLDFELCTLDVRVMEPAVILSGFLGQPEETKLKRRRRRLTLRREATHVGAGSERRIKAARTDRQEEETGLAALLLFLRGGEGVPKGYLLNLSRGLLEKVATVLWDDVTEELDK